MITCAVSISRKFLFVSPILAVGFWIFAEKGCVLTPDAVPGLASGAAGVEQLLRATVPMESARPAVFLTDPSAVYTRGGPVTGSAGNPKAGNPKEGEAAHLRIHAPGDHDSDTQGHHPVIARRNGPEYDRWSMQLADRGRMEGMGLLNNAPA